MVSVLCVGGDLNYQLTIYKSFSEPWVRFYAQEIILGLEHLHNLEIVYRDLKPANCLLSEQGHVRISDLGLACNVSTSKASDRVGTHGYMAPEILQKDTLYDCCSDWFSFGCMLYKLLTGHSPFRSRDKAEIDKLAMTMEIKMPDTWSNEARTLVSSLLEKDPRHRLGREGPSSVKQHKFFADTRWEDVEALKVRQ
jgi:beta-adrenergic-receptor kinase